MVVVEKSWSFVKAVGHWLWDHGAVTAVVAVGLSTVIAVKLISNQADQEALDRADQTAEFRHDTALNDYAGCLSGNRLRQANLDLLDGILALLDADGRTAFLPVWREAQADFTPRDCEPTRNRAVDAHVTPDELVTVEHRPVQTVGSLPLATCEGLGPFVRGVDDAYLAELDRDNDGISCEQGP